ncbi:hypothetical protein HK104_001840 [Borealophlyctis nickersoniae]|nr:hypothetical protein HK104_001840 [Borealophlyctis nickersoniae]
MQKQPQWAYDNLKAGIVYAIRSTGYRQNISVRFEPHAHKVSAYHSGALSKLAHNLCVKVLCTLTCLIIIFGPLYCISRKKIDARLVCEYPMLISDEQWFYANYGTIISGVVGRQTRQLQALPLPVQMPPEGSAGPFLPPPGPPPGM